VLAVVLRPYRRVLLVVLVPVHQVVLLPRQLGTGNAQELLENPFSSVAVSPRSCMTLMGMCRPACCFQ
jgi:hypothetical protein